MSKIGKLYPKLPPGYIAKSSAIVIGGGLMGFGITELLFGSERFYREVAMPLVHRFCDGETSHRLAVKVVQYGLYPRFGQNHREYPELECEVFGHKFKNPIGLAAGFDKDGEAIENLRKCGFGAVEIGNLKKADFSDLASPSESNDLVLDHSRINEGEVYLFKNRKHRHRAIPLIRTGSRFNDALTFKEWMKNATKSPDKVVKIVLRNTDVVRPVLQYLYAAQDNFESPILLHANVFRLAGTYDKTVDPLILIGSAQKMLPDATISLGWNDPKNITKLKASQKRVSWRRTFHMLNYINHISQPLILSMRLSLAQNSVDQLLWILGINQTISVVVWSDDQDDKNIEWYQILRLRSYAGKNKVIFDLLPKHRNTLEKKGRLPTRKDDQIDATWLEMHELSSARPVLSKTFQSDRGIAFLGWSNSFLLGKKSGNEEAGLKPMYYSGKVLFLPKKGLKHISPLEDSGLSLQLVDPERVSESGDVKSGIQILIGYDGRVFLENMDPDLEQSYNQRSSGRVQHYACYGFSIEDRGWRVEVDVWTDLCEGHHTHPVDPPSVTSLQLETPIRSRTPRSVMISKSGDGEIDFLVQKLVRNGSSFNSVISLTVLGLASLLYFF